MDPIAYPPGIDRAHPPVILFAFERASARAEVTMERRRPSRTFTKQEQFILKRLEKKRKLFGFLRRHQHEIFDDEFQAELESMYRETGAGKEPVMPALLAMALVLQGYLGMSDWDAVEASVFDVRWQMVLDRLGASRPAFSQGALQAFGERLIAHDMDRRLLERTIELARATREFDWSNFTCCAFERRAPWGLALPNEQVSFALAELGGHLRSNGPPGWIVLGRALERLLLLEAGWALARRHGRDVIDD
jgi:hypothetical protein